MTSTFNHLTLENATTRAAGNWRGFSCFCWHREREILDAQNWAIFYTHHRDSGLLDQSNAAIIKLTLESFTEGDDPDVVFESHSHWAVGHIEGLSVRVLRDGKVTQAFQAFRQIQDRLAEYPILDEEDYSRREFEATLENIRNAAWRLQNEYDLTDGYELALYSWLSDNSASAFENVDDNGSCPTEQELESAIKSLGFTRKS